MIFCGGVDSVVERIVSMVFLWIMSSVSMDHVMCFYGVAMDHVKCFYDVYVAR